jgi:hypothetical protein
MSTKKLSTVVSIFAIIALAGAAFVACGPSKPAGPSLTSDKGTYAPGETINVTFAAPAGLPDDAWVGIIPSGVPHGDEATNDAYDLTYQYLNGMMSGTLVFIAPTVPGSYDLRMHDTDQNGKEIASVTFTVK